MDPLKELEKEFPRLKEFDPFLEDWRNESERGAVVIAVSYLEDLLGNLIGAFVIEGADKALFQSGRGPLGTFYGRVLLAHAMGLISNSEKHDLHVIGKIRNELAHKRERRFEDTDISDLCRTFRTPVVAGDAKTLGAKDMFRLASVGMILLFLQRVEKVPEKRLKYTKWPN